jgi:hypothetical protein
MYDLCLQEGIEWRGLAGLNVSFNEKIFLRAEY